MEFLINPNIAYLFVVTAVMLSLWACNDQKSTWQKVGMALCFAAAGYEFVHLKWNIGHREAAQRYIAHGESVGNQQEMKAYYASMMKSANKLRFEMPATKVLIAYLN